MQEADRRLQESGEHQKQADAPKTHERRQCEAQSSNAGRYAMDCGLVHERGIGFVQ